MIIGIDLATVNCGLCFMQEDETCWYNTIGMPDLEPETINSFAQALQKVVHDQIVYVDFHYNECFLPNKRKHISIKYFLAGVIKATAKETHFIKPADVRKYYGQDPKMKKYKFHELMFDSAMMKEQDEHKRDAYLLALMGITEQSKKLNPEKWGN